MTATRAEPAELLDIEVDQLAGSGGLIAADRATRRTVQEGEPVEREADQEAVDG